MERVPEVLYGPRAGRSSVDVEEVALEPRRKEIQVIQEGHDRTVRIFRYMLNVRRDRFA